MRVMKWVFLGGLMLGLFALQAARADWVEKAGFIDYAQHKVGAPPNEQEWPFDGMPDFDQKQDNWRNANNQWTWCGPLATANCLWWFDSKFEMIKCKSLPAGTLVRPPTVSDHYSLVYDCVGGIDDHFPGNVVPWITALGNALPGGIPPLGVNAQQIKTMIENWLASAAVNLAKHYTVTIVSAPTFEYIYDQVLVSQDVILLLGFWQRDPSSGEWGRFGGHWVTVAGVDTQEVDEISFSDPCVDNAEAGQPGVVWDGWIIAHVAPHNPAMHNDAGNVSHDHYPVQGSGSPGGGISPGNYGQEFDYQDWTNFQGLNVPDRLSDYQSQYNPNWPVHTEIEDIVVVCPNFDYGDLHYDYPTIDIESCGPAHPLTDKAWLGDNISAEIQPRIDTTNHLFDQDTFDDGVQFVGLPWTIGTHVQVIVQVTTGPQYANEPLYLNAWKDGNIDGDFDDGPDQPPFIPAEDDWMQCTEWVIQDVLIDPTVGGSVFVTFTFCDPGYSEIETWNLQMRFRLTSQAVGRYGYGGYWGGGVSNGRGTYDIDWILGEVEDYVIDDGQQLAVEFQSFEAVPGDGYVNLLWTTASELDNDYFTLARRTGSETWCEISRASSHGNSTGPQYYSYLDADAVNDVTYDYRLTAVDLTGHAEVLALASATPRAEGLPLEYSLAQNHPNPFNANTEIEYALRESGHVSLKVYNSMGQLVAKLVNANQTADRYRVSFNAGELASGIYLYKLEVNDFTSVKKMVLLK